MNLFCISDNKDISVGLRLSGIGGIVLNNKEEIEKEIDKICEKRDIGILVITQNVYNLAEEKIKYIQEHQNLPLIVKIPNNNN